MLSEYVSSHSVVVFVFAFAPITLRSNATINSVIFFMFVLFLLILCLLSIARHDLIHRIFAGKVNKEKNISMTQFCLILILYGESVF